MRVTGEPRCGSIDTEDGEGEGFSRSCVRYCELSASAWGERAGYQPTQYEPGGSQGEDEDEGEVEGEGNAVNCDNNTDRRRTDWGRTL